MPQYQSYPTARDIPRRKLRKSVRRTIFWENKLLMNKLRKARKETRNATH